MSKVYVRYFIVVLVAVLLVQAAGAWEFLAFDECSQTCPLDGPSDSSDGRCAPGCLACPCALPRTFPPAQVSFVPALALSASAAEASARTPLPPHPQAILHVPKHAA